ncbi:MAG: Mur ligase family protein, partial [Gammaproteobacteria bacterium]
MDRASVKAQLKKQFSLDKERSKVLVVGLGVTGMSVARFLHGLGFNFAITDSRQKPQMIAEFFREMPDTPAFMGGFDDNAFKVATHLVVSPGVPLKENAIVQARANGAKILSDIDLFVCSVEAPIVAITGSNGKSTVTTMLGEMAKAAGKNPGIGGNLGTAALDLLHQDSDLYVLELSSFQL